MKTETVIYLSIALFVVYFLFLRNKQTVVPPAAATPPSEPSIIDLFSQAIASTRRRIGFDGYGNVPPTYTVRRSYKLAGTMIPVGGGSGKGNTPTADGCRCGH